MDFLVYVAIMLGLPLVIGSGAMLAIYSRPESKCWFKRLTGKNVGMVNIRVKGRRIMRWVVDFNLPSCRCLGGEYLLDKKMILTINRVPHLFYNQDNPNPVDIINFVGAPWTKTPEGIRAVSDPLEQLDEFVYTDPNPVKLAAIVDLARDAGRTEEINKRKKDEKRAAFVFYLALGSFLLLTGVMAVSVLNYLATSGIVEHLKPAVVEAVNSTVNQLPRVG